MEGLLALCFTGFATYPGAVRLVFRRRAKQFGLHSRRMGDSMRSRGQLEWSDSNRFTVGMWSYEGRKIVISFTPSPKGKDLLVAPGSDWACQFNPKG